jgi:hypothetical protein
MWYNVLRMQRNFTQSTKNFVLFVMLFLKNKTQTTVLKDQTVLYMLNRSEEGNKRGKRKTPGILQCIVI